jgi:hypothetical protein
MSRLLPLLAATSLSLGFVPLFAQNTIVPTTLIAPRVFQDPHLYSGMVSVANASGSASIVADGVVSTAAHVIFDDDAMTWEAIDDFGFFLRHHQKTAFDPVGTGLTPVGFMRWTSYASRVETDQSGSGFSTSDTFNLDFAVAWFGDYSAVTEVMAYPELWIDQEEQVGILRDRREKTIVGYPTDDEFIPSSDRGLMHRTVPGDYFCWWDGLTYFPETWRDSEDYWVATYDFEGVTTYGGNSGGPMYVRNDDNTWVKAGVVVGSGSGGGGSVLIRGIDEAAWTLIAAAIEERGAPAVRRIESLTASRPSPTRIELEWVDNCSAEAHFHLYRLDEGLWSLLATLEPNTTTYADTSALPGRTYAYRLQAESSDGNRPPLSPPVAVPAVGQYRAAAQFLGEPFLAIENFGDTNWFLDSENRLRAGVVRDMGYSGLRLNLIGPGTLSFSWSVSSEANPDYNDPDSNLYREIYDALFLYLNGEPVLDGDELVHRSGLEQGLETREITLPAGPHTIEWVYEKDPYTREGEDTGFLHSVNWQPTTASAYPIYGGFGNGESPQNGSTWFGSHDARALPWIAHPNLGWLYVYPGNGKDLYLYSFDPALGVLYTHPAVYPYYYHFARQSWVFYYPGTGSFGQSAWFTDMRTEENFSTRN